MAGVTGEGQQLAERLVVEAGVLADVERGEVEAESVHRAEHGEQVAGGDAARADFHEGGVEAFEVGGEFGGPVIGLARARRGGRAGGGEFQE